MIKKSAIVDNATVDAQDARVKKMMKLEIWFSEGSLGIEQHCKRSESRRRLGSVIDDRGAPGCHDRNRDEVQNILTEARTQRKQRFSCQCSNCAHHSERS